MREGFEHWKDRLEDEDTQDMVPGFDAQATWKKLQPRIVKPQPVKWQLFAAAMLVGLLIGAAVMHLWTGNADTSVTVVKQATQVVKETVAVHDTVYTTPATPPQAIAIVKTVRKPPTAEPKQKNSLPKPVVTTPEVKQSITIAQTEEPKPAEEQVAAIPQPKQRVVHLMDIENEDTKMALSAPTQPQRATVVSVLSSHHGATVNQKTRGSVIGVSLKN
jgi:outer membrane biosynthesis protein TonB